MSNFNQEEPPCGCGCGTSSSTASLFGWATETQQQHQDSETCYLAVNRTLDIPTFPTSGGGGNIPGCDGHPSSSRSGLNAILNENTTFFGWTREIQDNNESYPRLAEIATNHTLTARGGQASSSLHSFGKQQNDVHGKSASLVGLPTAIQGIDEIYPRANRLIKSAPHTPSINSDCQSSWVHSVRPPDRSLSFVGSAPTDEIQGNNASYPVVNRLEIAPHYCGVGCGQQSLCSRGPTKENITPINAVSAPVMADLGASFEYGSTHRASVGWIPSDGGASVPCGASLASIFDDQPVLAVESNTTPITETTEQDSTLKRSSPLRGMFRNKKAKTELSNDFQPSNYSVILGRGRCTESTGNKRFKVIVRNHLQEYLAAPGKLEKTLIVSKVINIIKEANPEGGAFVQYENGKWYCVGERAAREKVGACFRDAQHHLNKTNKQGRQDHQRERRVLRRKQASNLTTPEQK